MTYVLGIVAAALVVILFFRFTIPTLVGFLILMFSMVLYFAFSSTEGQLDPVRVRTPLAASEVEFEGVTLNQVESIWYLQGSMTNNSSSTLTQLGLSIQIENCHSGTECEVVGQDIVRIYDDVLPGQSAVFETLVDFRSAPTFDDWNWTYKIIEAVGE